MIPRRALVATLAVLVVAAAGIGAAVAGGADEVFFAEPYHRPGDVAVGEAGVSWYGRELPDAIDELSLEIGPVEGAHRTFAVLRAAVTRWERAPGLEYRSPSGDRLYATNVMELSFRVPALPPGRYSLWTWCPRECGEVAPFVVGELRVVGSLAPARPAAPLSAASPR